MTSETLLLIHFCSKERNSALFSLPLKGSEGNSESLLLFLFNGKEFRAVFFSAEGFGTEFRELCVPRNSRNSVDNNHLFPLFRFPRNSSFQQFSISLIGGVHIGKPPPPQLGSYTRTLLVIQDRRHLFVIPCLYPRCKCNPYHK